MYSMKMVKLNGLPKLSKKHFFIGTGLIVFALALAPTYYYYNQYQKAQKALANPTLAAEEETKALIEKYGMKVITSNEVRRKGSENIVRSVIRYLSDCTDIYVSFDVDSLDSTISKGTGTPVGNGLREREAEDLISKFMQNRKVCCFEITEVNPTLDKENLMSEIAFNILQRSVNVLMMS